MQRFAVERQDVLPRWPGVRSHRATNPHLDASACCPRCRDLGRRNAAAQSAGVGGLPRNLVGDLDRQRIALDVNKYARRKAAARLKAYASNDERDDTVDSTE
jgi:hypothetical protein